MKSISFGTRVTAVFLFAMCLSFSLNTFAKNVKIYSTNNGCKVMGDPYNSLHEYSKVFHVTWTGACKDGYADGNGTLAYSAINPLRETKELWEIRGQMVQGVFNGMIYTRTLEVTASGTRGGNEWFDVGGMTFEMGCQENDDDCKPYAPVSTKMVGGRASNVGNISGNGNSIYNGKYISIAEMINPRDARCLSLDVRNKTSTKISATVRYELQQLDNGFFIKHPKYEIFDFAPNEKVIYDVPQAPLCIMGAHVVVVGVEVKNR